MRYSKLKAEDVQFVEKLLRRLVGWTWIMTITLWSFAAFCAFVVIALWQTG